MKTSPWSANSPQLDPYILKADEKLTSPSNGHASQFRIREAQQECAVVARSQHFLSLLFAYKAEDGSGMGKLGVSHGTNANEKF
jgi:hypothetical protein